MSDGRERNGRFGQGNRANPNGRPRVGSTVNAIIMREMTAPLTVTENSKRKRISKLAASAKQIANQGASGDFKAAKLSMDLALKAENNAAAVAVPLPLTRDDRAIVERFITRLNLTQITEKHNDDHA